MEVLYATDRVREQCKDTKKAQKLFGGNLVLTVSLFARINALEQAETIKDIIVQPTFHFHKLHNKNGRNLEGYFAIDVKGRKEGWRLILQPLDNDKKPFTPCHIDEIAGLVKVVEVCEVSDHYDD